jgi:hypothetical protein
VEGRLQRGFASNLNRNRVRNMYWGRREAAERIYVMGRRVAPERICISFE